MTLEELKAALAEAKAKFEADQKNQALKQALDDAQKAYDDAVAEAEADKSKDDPSDDESKWDDKTKAYIKKLRDENATHRNKSKDLASKLKLSEQQKKDVLKAIGIEDESEKPEEKINKLTATTQQLEFDRAILESALEHGIGKDDLKYYKYLMSDAVSQLKEGEELSDEQLAEILAEAKKGRSKGAANTTVGKGKSGKEEPPPGNSKEVTLDQFCKMSITEKSNLYLKNPDKYAELRDEAKSKKRLV